MSAPSHLDWCGDADCGDVSHSATDAVRGSELRRHADAAMAMLANANDLIAVPMPPESQGWDRLGRIEAILRANRMHEGECAYFGAREKVTGVLIYAQCDCWLADPPQAPS